MKIENIIIKNWRPLGNPPGADWWKKVENDPDIPLAIEAEVSLKLSYNEYQGLLKYLRSKE